MAIAHRVARSRVPVRSLRNGWMGDESRLVYANGVGKFNSLRHLGWGFESPPQRKYHPADGRRGPIAPRKRVRGRPPPQQTNPTLLVSQPRGIGPDKMADRGEGKKCYRIWGEFWTAFSPNCFNRGFKSSSNNFPTQKASKDKSQKNISCALRPQCKKLIQTAEVELCQPSRNFPALLSRCPDFCPS